MEAFVISGLLLLLLCIVIFCFYCSIRKPRFLNAGRSVCPYEARTLLTNAERDFYQLLRPVAVKLNLHILSKIRVADLVDVQQGLSKSDWGKFFSKIRAKHVDFVLCNPETLEPALIIELDDPSHLRPDRMARDQFLDTVFTVSKLRILHVTDGKNLEQLIRHALKNSQMVYHETVSQR